MKVRHRESGICIGCNEISQGILERNVVAIVGKPGLSCRSCNRLMAQNTVKTPQELLRANSKTLDSSEVALCQH